MQNAPTIEERARKAKTGRKAPGTSGRLHRTEAGDWVWSSDEEEFIKDGSGGSGSGSAGGSSASGSRENTTNNSGNNIVPNIDIQNNSNKNNQQTQQTQQTQQNQQNQQTQQNQQNQQITGSAVQSQQHPLQQQNDQSNIANPINLVLRIRNSKKELNDIKFEFTPNKGII